MIRALTSLALLAALSGCQTGIATYEITPVRGPDGKLACCRATVSDGQDVSNLSLTVTEKPDGTKILQFSKSGASASAPITAQSADVTGIANAVGTAAAAVIKVDPSIP